MLELSACGAIHLRRLSISDDRWGADVSLRCLRRVVLPDELRTIPPSIPKEPLEPIGRQRGVPGRILNIPVSEVGLC